MNPTELGGDSAASEKSLRREGQVHCGCPAQRLSERLKAALIGAKVARALWVADVGPLGEYAALPSMVHETKYFVSKFENRK